MSDYVKELSRIFDKSFDEQQAWERVSKYIKERLAAKALEPVSGETIVELLAILSLWNKVTIKTNKARTIYKIKCKAKSKACKSVFISEGNFEDAVLNIWRQWQGVTVV